MVNEEKGSRGTDRRQGERRKAQLPFEGPDRRVSGDRRSGQDRRETVRRSGDRI